MSLTLTVDGERWRTHLRAFADRHPGLVPVAKGNGYGFTLGRLARKAEWLGADTLAVGTYEELPEVASRFDGDLLVLTPWRPFVDDLDPALADRVIHTVGRSDDLDALLTRQPDARVVLERMTSMLRHGFAARELWETALRRQLDKARLEGIALHLPLAQGAHIAEVDPAAQRRRRHGPRRRCSTRGHDHLGQPPHRRRARPAAHVVRRLHVPAPHRHRAVARRPRRR